MLRVALGWLWCAICHCNLCTATLPVHVRVACWCTQAPAVQGPEGSILWMQALKLSTTQLALLLPVKSNLRTAAPPLTHAASTPSLNTITLIVSILRLRCMGVWAWSCKHRCRHERLHARLHG